MRSLTCFERLRGHHVTVWTDCVRDIGVLAERLKDTEALVLLRERTRVTGDLIARLPRLKMITLNGPYPHVDVAACTQRGIVVCSEHARTSYATAELTWGLILCAMRHIPEEMANLKSGGWQTRVGTGLRGRTLAVYGYGRIGKQIAGFGKAFGMRVLVWAREQGRASAGGDGYETASNCESLFEEADVLTLHVRLVPETRHLIQPRDLARMKPTALFVNTSRAELVAPHVLAEALRAGRPGAAAIDVYESEPVFEGNDELVKLDNVVCTPHLGYVERDQLENYFCDQFDRILAFAAGKPRGVVNREVLA